MCLPLDVAFLVLFISGVCPCFHASPLSGGPFTERERDVLAIHVKPMFTVLRTRGLRFGLSYRGRVGFDQR